MMKIPALEMSELLCERRSEFRGIDKSDSQKNAFRDTLNMTCGKYPALSVRKKRGILNIGDSASDILSADIMIDGEIHPDVLIARTPNIYKTFYEENGSLISKNLMYSSFIDGDNSAVRSGAYLYFFPDKKYVNLMDTSEKSGLEYRAAYDLGANEDGFFYEMEVKNCDSEGNTVSEPCGYIKLTRKSYRMSGGVKGAFYEDLPFSVGLSVDDEVLFDGFSDGVCGYHEVCHIPQNRKFIVFAGVGDETVSSGRVSVAREVPDMDFVIAAKNRLWGCKYGIDKHGNAVNEIYASALGDAKNWRKYRDVSTDSWTASVGTPGAFTGAVCFDGNPVFFKENTILKVFGDYPSQFTVSESHVRGVEAGSHKSIAVVDDVLYYKTTSGIVRYDGGIPQNIDRDLGDTKYKNAVSGAHSHCYYIAMNDTSGNSFLFVYDTERGIWHRESTPSPVCFAPCGKELYMLSSDGTVYSVSGKYNSDTGSPGSAEADFDWSFESTSYGYETENRKVVRHIIFDALSEGSGDAEVTIEYDDSGEFIREAYIPSGKACREIRIQPKRCKSFRYRISGKGNFTLRSVTVRYEKRSTKAPTER